MHVSAGTGCLVAATGDTVVLFKDVADYRKGKFPSTVHCLPQSHLVSDFISKEQALGLLPRSLCCCSGEFRFSVSEETGREHQIIAHVFQPGFCWRPPGMVCLARENMKINGCLFPKE